MTSLSTHYPAQVGPYRCGGDRPLLLIAGPCVIETAELTVAIAGRLAEIAERVGVSLVLKASFDKANRTSIDGYRG
ncbi:MAG: 3-deoxy-8-phosphooctulonate synthase, partial [Pirellulales bacterium]